MDNYIIYNVPYLQRWDKIAHNAYGTPFQIEKLIRHNPHIPIGLYVEAGSQLQIPILEAQDRALPQAFLPPWKRPQPSAKPWKD